ncbi:MAG: transposase, partial [Candidatus Aenigmarchaeota archaeon]|nr:transposase [Candidatus Aenigmarchaeota archaeon]
MGITELADPIHVPIGLTVKEGNVNDMAHFEDTYNQIKGRIKKGSLVTFDKGANSKDNLELILADKMKYLTAKKLNKSDDKRIKEFDKTKAELIDAKRMVYGLKFTKPNSIDYFYFSEGLQKEQLEAKKRKAQRMFEEAKQIQDAINKNRELPKKFRINNKLVDVTYSYQTKLGKISEKEAINLVEKATITGREGFFCLKSSENLTLLEALQTYRKKDSIEKIFHSLKNEIEIKPLRVWSENSINGALIIGFIAQLFISLMRYDFDELKHTSTKFIKKSLMNLTVTVEFVEKCSKRFIYANFDPINELILVQNQAIT